MPSEYWFSNESHPFGAKYRTATESAPASGSVVLANGVANFLRTTFPLASAVSTEGDWSVTVDLTALNGVSMNVVIEVFATPSGTQTFAMTPSSVNTLDQHVFTATLPDVEIAVDQQWYVRLTAVAESLKVPSDLTIAVGAGTSYFTAPWGGAPAGGLAKVWTGAEWAEKPVKVWTGSEWAQKPVKFWNGSAWTLT